MSSHLGSRYELNYKRTSKPCSKEDCEVEHLSYCHEISNLQFFIESLTVHLGPSIIQVFINVCMESSISSNTLSGSGAKYLYGTVGHN